jgi:hypothetical protein
MKGLMTKRLWAKAVLLACGGLPVAGAGCCEYKDLVDPCYPQRYEHMARMEVIDPMGTQVAKGHALEQTVWNYHFDAGTDKLNTMGQDHLAYLGRRLPQADPILYLQTAQLGEVTYDPATPDKLTDTRADLDAKRIAAIQKFLNAQTAGKGVAFQVITIDPGEIGLPALAVGSAYGQMLSSRFKGGLGGGGGTTTGGGGAH